MTNERRSVLLVDDDPLVRRTLEAMLDRLGYAVRSVATAAAARDELDGSRFDVLVTDLQLGDLPGTEGLELVIWARRRAPGLRILLISGSATGAVAEEALSRGADAFLAKPITLAALRDELEG